jgi:hypothetical protein
LGPRAPPFLQQNQYAWRAHDAILLSWLGKMCGCAPSITSHKKPRDHGGHTKKGNGNMSKQETKFEFSKQLAIDLAKNGEKWETLLFKACTEAKGSEVKASEFCDALRATGFRCGTGPARAAYKAVRDGGDQKAMIEAIDAVKAKRKSSGKDGAGKGTGTSADGAGKGTGTAETLVGALTAALHAAQAGNIVIVETWLVKAQALLETAKTATAQAVERMGGVA